MSTAEEEPSNSATPTLEENLQATLSPIDPLAAPKYPSSGFVPLVTVVGFHHARGPEVETWFGAEEGTDPAEDYEWTLLPFMALSDGAHA